MSFNYPLTVTPVNQTRKEEVPMSERLDPNTGNPPQPQEHILQFFDFDHLPQNLQNVSRPFHDLAQLIVGGLWEPGSADSPGKCLEEPIPRNPERTVALRKLLEAKDAAVRAVIAK